jgi:hypothetical protein
MTAGRLRSSCIAVRILIGMVVAIAANWVLADERSKTLDIYCIDISASVGNATLIVSPSGETILLDAGPPRSELRTLDSREDLCANLGGPQNRNQPTRFIKISAHADGSFDVSNSRNGFTKNYAARSK